MNVQPLSTVRIPTTVNPDLKAKTPTSEHPRSGLRIPSTPTASASKLTKIPTPTGIQPRTIKSGSGIASNSRVIPVSPNKTHSYTSQKSISSLNAYGSSTATMVITGRKSATIPSKTTISSFEKNKKTLKGPLFFLKKKKPNLFEKCKNIQLTYSYL